MSTANAGISPITIECRDCGAKPGEKCTEPYFGTYQYTFHNLRIKDAASRIQRDPVEQEGQ